VAVVAVVQPLEVYEAVGNRQSAVVREKSLEDKKKWRIKLNIAQ
jgi:hypothetical protein